MYCNDRFMMSGHCTHTPTQQHCTDRCVERAPVDTLSLAAGSTHSRNTLYNPIELLAQLDITQQNINAVGGVVNLSAPRVYARGHAQKVHTSISMRSSSYQLAETAQRTQR
jgi:hypothetical protein